MGISLGFSGCLPQNSDSEQIGELLERIDELERELDVVKSQSTTSSPLSDDQLNELRRRVGEIEQARGQTQDAIVEEFKAQNEKLQRMFRGFNQMHDMIQTGQTWATFGLGYQGHTVARTRHGSFLIELENQEPTDGGYRLTLRIGNPTGLHVHQFKIYGDYGSSPPDVSDTTAYDDYVKLVDHWEGELKKFEANFVTSLKPNEWTVVGLVIPAQRLAELRFIRFRMDVDRTSLVQASDEEKNTHFGVDYKGATILETKHGTFPLTVKGNRKTDSGYEIDLLIGNPLGMTITSARLTGKFGVEAPKLGDGGDHSKYSDELMRWDQSLRPFEARISKSLIPFHWNAVTIKVPARDKANLEYIRAQLEILNVSLRNPE